MKINQLWSNCKVMVFNMKFTGIVDASLMVAAGNNFAAPAWSSDPCWTGWVGSYSDCFEPCPGSVACRSGYSSPSLCFVASGCFSADQHIAVLEWTTRSISDFPERLDWILKSLSALLELLRASDCLASVPASATDSACWGFAGTGQASACWDLRDRTEMPGQSDWHSGWCWPVCCCGTLRIETQSRLATSAASATTENSVLTGTFGADRSSTNWPSACSRSPGHYWPTQSGLGHSSDFVASVAPHSRWSCSSVRECTAADAVCLSCSPSSAWYRCFSVESGQFALKSKTAVDFCFDFACFDPMVNSH